VRHQLPIALALLSIASGARAHGPAPVALSVLTFEGEAAGVVHTNVGLASARGDGSYAYVCPSRWDGNPRALAFGVQDAVLVQSLGVAYLSRDAGCTFAPLVVADYVVRATSWEDGFALLVEGPGGREVLRVDAAGRTAPLPLALPADPDGLHPAGSALWLAGAGPPAFVARWDGELEIVWQGALPGSRAIPVAAEAGAAWLETSDGALVRVDAEGPGPARAFDRSRHGPIRVGDRTVALFDGVLHEWRDGAWRPDGERPWTCLEARGDRAFACSLDGTYELTSGEPTPFFSLRQLAPPDTCGAAEAEPECAREWAHFGGESGWLETDPALDPRSPRRPRGCAAAPGRSFRWPLLPLALLGLRIRSRGRSPNTEQGTELTCELT